MNRSILDILWDVEYVVNCGSFLKVAHPNTACSILET